MLARGPLTLVRDGRHLVHRLVGDEDGGEALGAELEGKERLRIDVNGTEQAPQRVREGLHLTGVGPVPVALPGRLDTS